MSADFDHHVGSYRSDVESSVAFTGKDADYFARRRAVDLVDLMGRHMGDPGRLEVLDVGCGVGVLHGHLAPHVGALHGADVATDAVRAASEANPAVSYSTYEGQVLPYDDATFDLAVAVCVFHHVDGVDQPGLTAEMARVVRPGGLVVIVEHNPFNPLTRVAVNRCEFDEGVVLLRRARVVELLAGAGLTAVERRYVVFVPLDGEAAHRVDRALRWLPLGGQHYVAARRETEH